MKTMENNMDGVKISVNKEGDEGTAKRRGRPKKAAKTVVSETKPVSQSVSSGSERKSKSNEKGSFMSTMLTVIITAIVVGGAIYAWQNKNSKEGIDSVREDARKVRVDFEQRMEQLKNKLTGIETENQKLKDTAKELEERVALLKGAKLEFSDPELGMQFEYPAILGEVKIEKVKGSSGFKFNGTFSKGEKLSFGGVSADYVPAASTSQISLLETQGFIEKGGKYYFQSIGKQDVLDYPVTPSKMVTPNIMLLDKKSFQAANASSTSVIDIAENVGALVNVGSEKVRGMAFLNQDLSQMPVENMEALLKGIQKK